MFFLCVLFVILAFDGCPADSDDKPNPGPAIEEETLAEPPAEAALFDDVTLKASYKKYGNHNPVMSQWFSADPWGLEYGDRVYLYLSDDHYPGYGNISDSIDPPSVENNYSTLTSVHIISSTDMVNWTDHGLVKVAGSGGVTSWASQSFAPCVAYKEIGGEPKFFLYFGNNANGIGVLTSNSPIGPWSDPVGYALITKSTPNCNDLVWCFDPAVLVDDDRTGWLYFGGGVAGDGQDADQRPIANPGTARVVKLGADMISLAADPVKIDFVPYLLEDFGINKLNGTYIFSYCSNSYHPEGRTSINYLTSGSPAGPFASAAAKWPLEAGEEKVVESKLMMKNPVDFGMRFTNNHHAMFQFKGKYYMAYQTVELEDERAKVLGYAVANAETGRPEVPADKDGYRSIGIDRVSLKSDGTITPVTMTQTGVTQAGTFNPYVLTEAETVGVQGGITTNTSPQASGGIAVTGINTGDWIALYGVNFGTEGATKFECRVTAPASGKAIIQIRDGLNGPPLGYATIETDAENPSVYRKIEAGLLKRAKGIKDLVFVFYGEGWEFDSWQFSQ
jgi:arabinoxylan arabinofuranohydrolase